MRIRTYIFGLLTVILPVYPGFATDDAATENGRTDRTAIYQEVEGLIIDSIVIEPRNIYDTRHPKYDNILFRTANKLHIVTDPQVVKRELLFAKGEPFSADAATETARNLRTRLAVNTAWIEPERLENGHLLVRVVTIDEWSLIASAKVAREGNETDYRFGIEERNFLGNHQFWTFDYYIQARDENYHVASFRDSRLFGWPMQIAFADQNNPMNTVRELSLGHPFYNQLQRFAISGVVASTSARTDLYREGTRIAQWNDDGDLGAVSGEYRWGSRFQKIGLGLGYLYRHTSVLDPRVIDEVSAHTVQFPGDSTYHQLSPSLSYSNIKFALIPHIQRSVYPEDVTLGTSLKVSYGRAFSPGLSSYVYDVASFTGVHLHEANSNLFGISFVHEFTFRSGDYFRRATAVTLKYYNNYLPWFTLASQGKYTREWRSDGLASLHLGGRSGIRGYDPFFLTGSSMGVLNIEGRFFPNIEILSTVIGAAVFADLGTVWQEDQRAFSQPIYRSIGAGLRVSLEKLTKEEQFRIDVSFGQDNAWEISFSNHQYFSL